MRGILYSSMERPKLGENFSDHVVRVSDIASGFLDHVAPGVGGVVAELIRTIIPNQRIDRIQRFLEILAEQLKEIGEELAKLKLQTPNGSSLLEEGLLLAYRANTDARRAHIASIIINGIRPEDMPIFEAKRMLSLLDELTEPEIIILQAYGVGWLPIQPLFRENHDILFPQPLPLSAPTEARERFHIQKSYHQHLEQLGLVEPKIEVASSDRIQMALGSRKGSKIVRSRGDITELGRAFLRFVGAALERDPLSPMHTTQKR